jgi:hypothetical protein
MSFSNTQMHATFVLLGLFIQFAYRDIWPLLTFTLHPLDEQEGVILWVKSALTIYTGLVVPLFEPFPYKPFDPSVCSCSHPPIFSSFSSSGASTDFESRTNRLLRRICPVFIYGSTYTQGIQVDTTLRIGTSAARGRRLEQEPDPEELSGP